MPIVERRARASGAAAAAGTRSASRPIERIRNAAKADLVTNSFATRCRLRRICRPSATIGGHGREVARDEHEVGDAARHLRAAALRDRQPGRLQRRDVVDAVADHRDVAARRRAAPRRRALVLAARSGRRRVARAASAPQLAARRRAARRPSTARADRRCRRRGDRRDGLGPVAREHLQLDALRVGRSRPSRAPPGAAARRARRADELARAGGAAARPRRAGVRRPPSASTRRPAAAARSADASASAAERRSARARRARSATPPSRSALQRRRDENGTCSLDRLRVGREALGDRLERGVARRRRRGVARRAPRSSLRVDARRRQSSTTRSVGSVSVPVLSRQTTSTEASDSIAFSCWASAPRRAIRSAATA